MDEKTRSPSNWYSPQLRLAVIAILFWARGQANGDEQTVNDASLKQLTVEELVDKSQVP